MKKSRFLITLIIVGGWCIFFNCWTTHAAEMPVTVQLQLPAANKSNGLVNMDVQPQQKIHFVIWLHNISNKKVSIKVGPGVAKNDNSGQIVLGDNTKQWMDSSWRYHLRNLGFSPRTVSIPAQKIKKIPVTLQAPNYQGSISGSIIVQPVLKLQRHTRFPNQIQQAYGVLLNVGNYEDVKPHLRLGKVYLQAQGGQATIVGAIHNRAPIYYGNGAVSYSAQLQDSHGKKVASVHLPQAALAANAIVPLTITWGNHPVQADTYLFKAQVKIGDQLWHFQRHLTISNRQALQLNRQNRNLQPNRWPLIIFIICIALIALGLFLWGIFWYAKNQGSQKIIKKK